MPEPNFFIVGAPKCGTTAMHSYLAAHPQIYMSPLKEPTFFATDFDSPKFRLYRNPDTYRHLFKGAGSYPRIGESSVWYLYSQVAARNIHAFNPSTRIIIMLRSPAEVMYSLYAHFVYSGNETAPTFETALALEEVRKQGHGIPRTMSQGMPEALYYREVVAFTDQVKRYFDQFGRDAVHVIIFDDFKTDTAAAYRATLDYLDVDRTFEPQFEQINPSHRIRSHRLHDGYNMLVRFAMLKLTARTWPVFSKLVIAPLRTLNTYAAPRTPMNMTLRAELNARLLPDVERLSELLGRDLTHWCR